MPKILNFGSLNLDLVYTVSHIAGPGETISSTNREIFPGGKGLNQSIAAARAGACVFHAGAVGKDGERLLDVLKSVGVNTEYIKFCDTETGHAIIQVDKNGENAIVLFNGANYSLSAEDVTDIISQFSPGDFILLQNEINVTDICLKVAKKHGLITVLNVSPITADIGKLPLSLADIIFVNETEALAICNESDNEKLLDSMSRKFLSADIILTLGEDGAKCKTADGNEYTYSAHKVSVRDTTAAGDTFTGYYVAAITAGKTTDEALRLANAAAAITVSRKGASASIPKLGEVTDFIKADKYLKEGLL
jgi:ribokinase